MTWAGSPFAQRIEFSTGLPAGAVSYQLLDANGDIILSNELTPADGAFDCLIVIAGEHNTTTKDLFDSRTLAWHYLTAHGLVADRVTYKINKPLPFAATAAGVRTKLGVEDHELANDEIDLTSAYAEFTGLFEADATAAYRSAGNRGELLCIHAIEALAGLSLLGALQLKLAQRESTGTNEYARFSKVDWSLIEHDLVDHVARVRELILGEDAVGNVTSFVVISPTTDAFTGNAN